MDKIKVFKLVREHNIKIYENKNCLPRVFIVYNHLILNDKKKIIKKLLDEKFDPEQIVILENIEEGAYSHNTIINKGLAEIVEYKINEVKIKTYLPYDGYLILLDTYYPGWNVFIDGKKGKILKAYYAFRAVFLKKGNHIVKFVYSPLSFKLGVVITFCFFIFIIAMQIIIGSRQCIEMLKK
jgi:hypothetical protein